MAAREAGGERKSSWGMGIEYTLIYTLIERSLAHPSITTELLATTRNAAAAVGGSSAEDRYARLLHAFGAKCSG